MNKPFLFHGEEYGGMYDEWMICCELVSDRNTLEYYASRSYSNNEAFVFVIYTDGTFRLHKSKTKLPFLAIPPLIIYLMMSKIS